MHLIVSILSRLSLNTLYHIADGLLYPLFYYVIRYRRRLVRQNLVASFPEKTPNEISEIEKKYYQHLTDLIVEIIYSYRVSDEEMSERVQYVGSEQAVQLAKQYGGCILMLGHVCNWEWLADVSHYMERFGIESTHIYRKQKNKNTNDLMLDLRQKRGGNYCDKNIILRTMIQNRRHQSPQLYSMIADQKPSVHGEHYVTQFLNQTTAFLVGTETLAKKFAYPVFFCDIRQKSRGYYEAYFKLLTDKPQETETGEITEKFVRLLEDNIRERPELWLWSHNRWRRKK